MAEVILNMINSKTKSTEQMFNFALYFFYVSWYTMFSFMASQKINSDFYACDYKSLLIGL